MTPEYSCDQWTADFGCGDVATSVLVAQPVGGFTAAFLGVTVMGVLSALLVLTGIRMRPRDAVD